MIAWRPGVRTSLTIWYTAATAVILAAYAGVVYIIVGRNASRTLDARLHSDVRWVIEMADQNPDGSLLWFEGDDASGEDESPWVQVWSPSGELLLRSNAAERIPIEQGRDLALQADGQIRTVPVGAVTYRIVSAPATIIDRRVVVQVAGSEQRLEREASALLLIMLLGLPLGVVLSGIGGYVLARRALAPVDRMAERARSITAARLSDRLPVDNPEDELGRLAGVFNDTLGALEASFDQMRRFTANVSHELRTPLTAIRAVGEVGLRTSRSEQECRAVVGSMLEEVDRLTLLVDRLLAFSRAEHARHALSKIPIDAGDLANDVVRQLHVLAEEKQQSLTVECDGSHVCVGDPVVLRQAIMNLVDNAIRYTPERGHIRVRLSEGPTGVVVDVIDDGPGVPAERRASSLGLTIATWAAEANGGQLTLEPGSGSGSTFRVTVPVRT